MPVIHEVATKEHTLMLAGVERASGLSACLTEDGDNLLVPGRQDQIQELCEYVERGRP